MPECSLCIHFLLQGVQKRVKTREGEFNYEKNKAEVHPLRAEKVKVKLNEERFRIMKGFDAVIEGKTFH